ncbi:MAG: MFS transporter [Sphingorhabdus sp.]
MTIGTVAHSRRTAGLIAFFLFLHIVNQIDRQLVASFAPDIMRDLELSRSQFALVAGIAFSGFYAVAAIFAGVMADRIGRVPVLTFGVGIWSLFTGLTGMAQGFWTMLLARPFVATGEATLVPAASSIILSRVADRMKATAIGIFFAGIPLGVGASFLIAGQLGPLIGWRYCFVLMAVVGLVATLIAMRIKDDSHLALNAKAGPSMRELLAELWAIAKTNPRYRYATLAIILLHAHSATGPFIQLWLHDDKGLPKESAASLYGSLFIVVGLAGSMGAGMLTDWLHRRSGTDRARTLSLFLLGLAPLILAYRLAPADSPLFLAGMVASILYISSAYGPVFSVIEEELPRRLVASSTGFAMLAINLIVVGAVTLAIGAVSQLLHQAGIAQSWTIPMLGADCIALTACVLLWLASRHKSVMRES